MSAATQAGMAFSNSSVTLVHGMSRPIGAHFHVAHGLSNAMLFPAVTAFSVSGAMQRYAECARAYGVADPTTSDEIAAGRIVDALAELCDDLEVPTPKSYGIDHDTWTEADAADGTASDCIGFPGEQSGPTQPRRHRADLRRRLRVTLSNCAHPSALLSTRRRELATDCDICRNRFPPT